MNHKTHGSKDQVSYNLELKGLRTYGDRLASDTKDIERH